MSIILNHRLPDDVYLKLDNTTHHISQIYYNEKPLYEDKITGIYTYNQEANTASFAGFTEAEKIYTTSSENVQSNIFIKQDTDKPISIPVTELKLAYNFYTTNIETLPSTITSIPEGGCAISGVRIFNSGNINTIGAYGFANAINLETVKFSGNISTIGAHAFMDCKKLTTLTFEKLTNNLNIDSTAFNCLNSVLNLNLLSGSFQKVNFNGWSSLTNLETCRITTDWFPTLDQILLPNNLQLKWLCIDAGTAILPDRIFTKSNYKQIGCFYFTSDSIPNYGFEGCQNVHLNTKENLTKEYSSLMTTTKIGDFAFSQATFKYPTLNLNSASQLNAKQHCFDGVKGLNLITIKCPLEQLSKKDWALGAPTHINVRGTYSFDALASFVGDPSSYQIKINQYTSATQSCSYSVRWDLTKPWNLPQWHTDTITIPAGSTVGYSNTYSAEGWKFGVLNIEQPLGGRWSEYRTWNITNFQ